MILSKEDSKLLMKLKHKISEGNASSSEMDEYVRLLRKSGASNEEIEKYIQKTGHNSTEEYNNTNIQKEKQETMDTLVGVGIFGLFFYGLSRLFKK